MQIHWRSFVFLLLPGLMVWGGCKHSRDAAALDDRLPEERKREIALQHYVEGLVYDQKGEHAKAILEYQDALRYDNDPAIYYALSKDYSIVGKHALAAEKGQQAVALDPANRTYRENLAEIYVNAFEIDKAIAAYEAVVALDSQYIDGLYNLARLYHMRKPLKAIELYRSILDRFGPTWDVYAQLLSLHTSMGKFDEAAAVIHHMLDIDPGNYELRRSLAEMYMQSGKKDEALREYFELLDRNPNDLEVRAAVAHVCLVQQRYDEATKQIESVLIVDTLSVETQLQFGQYFASFLQKDSAAAPYAYNIFEKIRGNYPDDWRPYWFLGVIASIMRNDSAAETNLERVTMIAPQHPEGWTYYASLYLERNEYGRAAEILERARTHLPREARIHFLLGWSYHRLKRNDLAVGALERAVELNPGDVNTLSTLALVFDEMRRYADSDSLYEQALKVDPDNHLIQNNYSYSLAERGEDLDRALTMAREAVRQQPENPSYLDTYGWIYFKLGNYEEAERFVRKAVELGDVSPVVLEHLGDIYAKLGKKQLALEFWNRALEKDLTNESLKTKITRGSL